jgi:hypothetical protein
MGPKITLSFWTSHIPSIGQSNQEENQSQTHTHPREETGRDPKWKQLQCDFLRIKQHLEVVLLVVEPALRPDSKYIKLQNVYGMKAT